MRSYFDCWDYLKQIIKNIFIDVIHFYILSTITLYESIKMVFIQKDFWGDLTQNDNFSMVMIWILAVTYIIKHNQLTINIIKTLRA